MDKCSIIKLLNGAAVVRKVCGIIMTLKQVLDALDSCGLEYSCSEEYESETEYVKALLQRICESEGDKPHIWFGSIPYDNFYDAFESLKNVAKDDVSFE